MATVFWNSQVLFLGDHLEKGKTINDEYYVKLLQQLRDRIIRKRLHLAKKKMRKSTIVMAKIHEFRHIR